MRAFFQNQFFGLAEEWFWWLPSTFLYISMNIIFQLFIQVHKEKILLYMRILKSFIASEDKYHPCWLVAQPNLQLDT